MSPASGFTQLPQLGLRVSIISIGTILIGVVPLCYYRWRYNSRFYTDPPESAGAKKRHDDRIDGERIAGLNIYLVNRRIEFGAYGGLHFHRLDNAERFAGPDRLPGCYKIDLTRQGIGHRRKLEPVPIFFSGISKASSASRRV